jgi:hypothetical protein
MAELKPCPFCGEAVKLKKTGLTFDQYYIEHDTNTSCILYKGKCFHAESDVEATYMWNMRVENG